MRICGLLAGYYWAAFALSECFSDANEVVKLEDDNFRNERDFEEISSCQPSPCRIRQKRHTADHLINDNVSRHLKSNARMQMLTKLLQMVGPSPDSSCNCGFSNRGLHTKRTNTGELLKKSDAQTSADCKCDTTAAIRHLLDKLRAAKGLSAGKGEDQFSQYVSRMSETGKLNMRNFLHEEGRRIRRHEMLRRRRRRRIHMQYLKRMRMLRTDPNAAFRGKQFLSF